MHMAFWFMHAAKPSFLQRYYILLTFFFHLQKTALDFLNPLAFHLYYGIHEYEYEPPRGDNPEKFVGGLPPIIDESICGNGTYIDEVGLTSQENVIFRIMIISAPRILWEKLPF